MYKKYDGIFYYRLYTGLRSVGGRIQTCFMRNYGVASRGLRLCIKDESIFACGCKDYPYRMVVRYEILNYNIYEFPNTSQKKMKKSSKARSVFRKIKEDINIITFSIAIV